MRDIARSVLVFGLAHFQPEVARACVTDTANTDTRRAVRRCCESILDQNGFADARAAEQADLAALEVGAQEVDDLEAVSRTSALVARSSKTGAGRWIG